MNSERSNQSIALFPEPSLLAPCTIVEDSHKTFLQRFLPPSFLSFNDYSEQVQICSEPGIESDRKESSLPFKPQWNSSKGSVSSKTLPNTVETSSSTLPNTGENTASSGETKRVQCEVAGSGEKSPTDNSVDGTSSLIEVTDNKLQKKQVASTQNKTKGGETESLIKAKKRGYAEVFEATKRFFGLDWEGVSTKRAKQFIGINVFRAN